MRPHSLYTDFVYWPLKMGALGSIWELGPRRVSEGRAQESTRDNLGETSGKCLKANCSTTELPTQGIVLYSVPLSRCKGKIGNVCLAESNDARGGPHVGARLSAIRDECSRTPTASGAAGGD